MGQGTFHPQPVPLNEKTLHYCPRALQTEQHFLSLAHPARYAGLCFPRPPILATCLTPHPSRFNLSVTLNLLFSIVLLLYPVIVL